MQIQFSKSIICFLFWATLSALTRADSLDNFYQVLPGVYIENSLSGDSVLPLAASGLCPNKWSRVIGTDFCTRNGYRLSILDGAFIVKSPLGECTDRFKRSPNADVCIADHLVLDYQDHNLKLVSPSGDDCPRCIPGRILPNIVFDNPFPPVCPIGFIKPPGVTFCFAMDYVLKVNEGEITPQLAVPRDSCLQFWERQNSKQYCLPQFKLASCGDDTFPCADNAIESFSVFRRADCPGLTVPFGVGNVTMFNESGPTGFSIKPVLLCIPGRILPN